MGLWNSIKRLLGVGPAKRSPTIRAPTAKPPARRVGTATVIKREPRPAPSAKPQVQAPAAQPEPPSPSGILPAPPMVSGVPSSPGSATGPGMFSRRKSPAMLVRAPLPDDLLQFSGSQPAQPVVEVVVGFDFGTSSSKVVLQTPYKMSSRAVPVAFGPLGHPMLRFLLRSVIAERPDGRYSLEFPADGCPVHRDLKVRLLATNSTSDADRREDEHLARADDDYVNTAARQVLLRMIDYVRHRRDPNAEGWRSGVPVFVCGGGSSHETVLRLVSLANSTGRRNWTSYRGLNPRPLPVPAQLAGNLDPSVYQSRMSVAYGLSFPGINIGPINPPKSIDDVRPPDRFTGGRWKDRFVDKDQV